MDDSTVYNLRSRGGARNSISVTKKRRAKKQPKKARKSKIAKVSTPCKNPESSIEDIVNTAVENVVHQTTKEIQDALANGVEPGDGAVNQVIDLEEELSKLPQLDDDYDEDLDDDYSPSDEYTRNGSLTEAAYEAANIIERLKRDLWKRELSEEEIQEYQPIINAIENEKLSFPKILRSNLTFEEKKTGIENFMIYPWYSHQCKNVSKLIHKRSTISSRNIKQYEELEKNLQRINIRKLALKDQILDMNIDEFRKSIIYEKYQYYNTLEITSSDYAKMSEWLTSVLKMPWNISKELPINCKKTKKQKRDYLLGISEKLDKCAHGMKRAKEEILLYACDKLTVANSGKLPSGDFSYVLALEGPPGVGKTLLLKNLSQALELPLEIIPLGGCQDSSYLEGHSYTYEGSKPGRIVEALKNMRCNNGIIYFDELDKLSESQKGQEVSSLLLHILDPVLNIKYQDKYFSDLHIDLSKIMFVISINDRNKIPEALRHRIKIVKIKKPQFSDKIQVVQNFFLPDFAKVFAFNEGDLVFSKNVCRYIIEKTEQEDGYRNLKRNVYGILSRINYLRQTHDRRKKQDKNENISFCIPDFKLPLQVTCAHIDTLMRNMDDNDFDAKKMLYT